MTVYLLHITPRYKHARHYIGFTIDDDALRRVGEHERGTKKGSPLVRAALDAGHTVKLAAVWPGADRNFERKLKNRKNAGKFCPCCNSKSKQPIYEGDANAVRMVQEEEKGREEAGGGCAGALCANGGESGEAGVQC